MAYIKQACQLFSLTNIFQKDPGMSVSIGYLLALNNKDATPTNYA